MNHDNLKLTIAHLFYEEDLSKVDIAKRLKISRFQVARLLEEARKDGTVQIRIIDSPNASVELELALLKRFGLSRVRVVKTSDSLNLIDDLGFAGVEMLTELADENEVLGVGWGETIKSVANHLPVHLTGFKEVVQVVGALPTTGFSWSPVEVSLRFATATQSLWHPLQAPAFVSNSDILNALRSDPGIHKTLSAMDRISMVIFSCGGWRPKITARLLETGYLNDSQIEQLIEANVAADILTSFLNGNGEPISTNLDNLVLSMSLSQLKSVPTRILVAGGVEKLESINAVLLGGYANVLATDIDTAHRLLNLSEDRKSNQLA